MKSYTPHYYLAPTITDALEAMRLSEGKAKLLAGGTDLLLELDQGHHSCIDTLVDISQLEELKKLEIQGENLFIGAGVTHNVIANSNLVLQHAQALAEASGMIGGAQVRNVATIGGNVAHALPAADGTIALIALNAQAIISSAEGERVEPLCELFLGPGESRLDPIRELLIGFLLPMNTGSEASSFQRVMRPQGIAIAILNCAVHLTRNKSRIEDMSICIGPAAPTPKRLKAVEKVFIGQTPDIDLFEKAFDALAAEAHFRSSKHRASSIYRHEIAKSLLKDCTLNAWKRAGGSYYA